MTVEQIKEKIEATKANIVKFEKALANAEKAIKKAETVLSGFAEKPDMNTPAGWDYSDAESKINEKTRTIKTTNEKIEKARETLAGLETKLTETELRNAILKKEFPAEFEALKNEMVERWNEYDKAERAKFRADKEKMSFKEMTKKYGWDTEKYRLTDSEIMKQNTDSANELVVGMFFRVREFTGPVKRIEQISVSGPALNGIVHGENGAAAVETIVAGGYNIQRLHVRVLVKKYKF